MKLLSLFFGLSLFGQSVLSHPLDLPFKLTENELDTLERRQSGVISTTGAAGSVQPRLEIRQMKTRQPNQFTLLILALQQWQAQSQSDSTSYYQISGIHGVPRQDWNGVGQCSTCTGVDGYCFHDSVNFPAWHRAYLALFEQEFVNICKSIASSWPTSGARTTRRQMQNAANKIRWPYWDWAAAPPGGGNNLPGMLSNPSITINAQNGRRTIDNPLYQHKFEDPSQLRYSPFAKWPNTLRYPTSTAADATSNEGAAITALNNIRASLQDQVYQLFTTCKDYLHFSNDAAGSSTTSCSNSLEGIHNTIHTTTGGRPTTSVKTSGHMYYLATAAFDPIFWLHHCNVDRIFAMWQTVNGGSYGASQTAPHNTWTVAKGSTQNQNSPLAPFYRDGSSFWTTALVKDWTVFKYTYPEFAHSDGSASSISNYINKLYGPGASATAGSSKRSLPGNSTQGYNSTEPSYLPSDLPFGLPFGLPDDLLPSLTADNGSTFEYVANIKTPRYALNGSYYVFLFLGEPENDEPDAWMDDANLVGPMGVLAQPDMQSSNVVAAGSIPLTRTLTSKLGSGLIGDLTEMIVSPFLEDMLRWRILGPDGTAVDPSTIPDFEVSVYASTSTQPGEEGSLPEWSEFIPMPKVTHGKPGGLGQMMGGGSGGAAPQGCKSPLI